MTGQSPKGMRLLFMLGAAGAGVFALLSGDDAHGFVRGYLWDIACPALAFFFLRLTTAHERLPIALAAFGACTLGEFAQLFLQAYTFDWFDVAAYACGTAIAVALDMLATPKRSPQDSS